MTSKSPNLGTAATMIRLSQRDLAFAISRVFVNNRGHKQQETRNVTSLLQEAVGDLLARSLTAAGYVVFKPCPDLYLERACHAAHEIVEVRDVVRAATASHDATTPLGLPGDA